MAIRIILPGHRFQMSYQNIEVLTVDVLRSVDQLEGCHTKLKIAPLERSAFALPLNHPIQFKKMGGRELR